MICRSYKDEKSRNNILFINAKHLVTRKNAESYLEPEHIAEIANCFHSRVAIPGFSNIVSLEEVRSNRCYLSIGLYVERPGDEDSSSFEVLCDEWQNASDNVNRECNALLKLIES